MAGSHLQERGDIVERAPPFHPTFDPIPTTASETTSSTSIATTTASEATGVAETVTTSTTASTLATSASTGSDDTTSTSIGFSAASVTLLSSTSAETSSTEQTSALSGVSALSSSTGAITTTHSIHPTTSSASSTFDSDPVSTISGTPITNGTDARHFTGLSTGAMAAAIVVPILLALFGLLLAFLCLRRRAQASHRRAGSGAAFLPIVHEKQGSRDSAASAGPKPRPAGNTIGAPIVTSERNNAYFTGLDTSSHTSRRGESAEYSTPERRSLGGTFAEPPPPYKGMGSNDAIPDVPPLPVMGAVIAASDERNPPDEATPRPSITGARSPPAEQSPGTASGALPLEDPGLAVSPTDERPTTSASQRSITSTLYSDSASVHDAQTARLSIGPVGPLATASLNEQPIPVPSSAKPTIVSSGSGLGLRTSSDPFGDPKSPVSSLSSAGSSYHPPTSRTGSFESGVSDVTP